MNFAQEAIKALHNTAFPVYAVPPSEWHGDVMVGGLSGNKIRPLSIRLRYDDDLLAEHPSRRIEIGSIRTRDPRESPAEGSPHEEHAYVIEIANFANNISPVKLADDVNGMPRTGTRRLMDAIPSIQGYQMDRVTFDEYSELRLYRIQMPEVEILTLAWGWDDESLTEFMSLARPISADDNLLGEIERAEQSAWEKIRQRKQGRAAD